MFHERTKYTKVDYHLEVITNKQICTPYTKLEEHLANIFTKALNLTRLYALSDKLSLIDILEGVLKIS